MIPTSMSPAAAQVSQPAESNPGSGYRFASYRASALARISDDSGPSLRCSKCLIGVLSVEDSTTRSYSRETSAAMSSPSIG